MDTKELHMFMFLYGWHFEDGSWGKDEARVYDRTTYSIKERQTYIKNYAYTPSFLTHAVKDEFDTIDELVEFISNGYERAVPVVISK